MILLVGVAGIGAADGFVVDRGAVSAAPVAAPASAPPAASATTPARARAASPAPASRTVVVRRCTGARGNVTLTDGACPAGTREQTRQMTRPTDPAPRPNRAPPHPSTLGIAPVAVPEPEPEPQREFIAPPAMYQCISYDGVERWSESYDPNPRCEPLVIYYPYPNNLTPAQALSCRWVEDSCVRLSDASSCVRWRQKYKDAISEATRAFSDTAQYWKSERARIGQIIEESCP